MKRIGCKADALLHLRRQDCLYLSAAVAIHGDAKRSRSVLHWLCVVAAIHETTCQGKGTTAELPTLGRANRTAQF